MKTVLKIDREKIAKFCRAQHISHLALFGSVLREDFTEESDVDVLVEFQPGHVPGFIRLHNLEQELSCLLESRKVDLVTRKSLNRRIREDVLAHIEVLYDEGYL